MFQSISWAEFFTAIFLTALAYYAVVSLLLYGNNIVNFIKGLATPPHKTSPEKQESDYPVTELMGVVKTGGQTGKLQVLKVDSDQLIVNPTDQTEDPISIDHSVRQATSIDEQIFLEDANALINVISRDKSEEAITLLRALLRRHAHLSDQPFRDRMSIMLRDSCHERKINFDLNEIKSWWPL